MTPNEYIKENKLEWQPSFNGSISSSLNAYRGALIVEEGKKLSETKVMPPKAQAKQVIMISENDKVKFFACELETFNHFEQFFEKYKNFFDKESIIILYVIDLDGNGIFEYEGIKFNAIMLYENSVWNEVLDEEIKKEVLLEKATEKILPEEKPKEIIKVVEQTSTLDRIIFFFLGIAFSILIISLYFYVITSKRKKQEDKPLVKKVKESKTKDELLKILAVYLKIDVKLDAYIFELEKTKDIDSLKKEIIKTLKELKL